MRAFSASSLRTLAAVFSIFAILFSSATVFAQVIPSYEDASVNWKMAGMQSVGGIPNRTTICATLSPLGSGQDDFNQIQNAINNCPTGQVILLNAGTFNVKIADL